MWTLKDEYRDLLDEKLNAATKAEALEALLANYELLGGDRYEIKRPELFYLESEATRHEFEMSLWRNAYRMTDERRCFLPKEELLELLQEAITERCPSL